MVGSEGIDFGYEIETTYTKTKLNVEIFQKSFYGPSPPLVFAQSTPVAALLALKNTKVDNRHRGKGRRMQALELARSSQWVKLAKSLDEDPSAANAIDPFGMFPLHWVCTDKTAPASIVEKLLSCAPESVSMRNKGGLLPLHIAVKAKLSPAVLEMIVDAFPKALFKKTLSGETPMDLVKNFYFQQDVYDLLTNYERKMTQNDPKLAMEQRLRQERSSPLSEEATAAHRLKRERMVPPSRDAPREEYPLPPQCLRDHRLRRECTLPPLGSTREAPAGRQRGYSSATKATSLPAWKKDDHCHICNVRFGYMRTRHHCRRCGHSVCSVHSKQKLALPQQGYQTPQRVCSVCYVSIVDQGSQDEKTPAELSYLRSDEEPETLDHEGVQLINSDEWLAMQEQVAFLQDQVNQLLRMGFKNDDASRGPDDGVGVEESLLPEEDDDKNCRRAPVHVGDEDGEAAQVGNFATYLEGICEGRAPGVGGTAAPVRYVFLSHKEKRGSRPAFVACL